MTLHKLRLLAIWLGCLSSTAILLSLMALADTYHGEADLSLEWMILRFAFAAIIAFHVAGLIALSRLRAQT
jgi:hypothetical protein